MTTTIEPHIPAFAFRERTRRMRAGTTVRELRRRVLAPRQCRVGKDAINHDATVRYVLAFQKRWLLSAVIALEMTLRKKLAFNLHQSETIDGSNPNDTIIRSWMTS